MAKKTKETKYDGDIIVNEFLNLQSFVGQNLRLMVELTDGYGLECPVAFEETVRHLSNSALIFLNDVLGEIAAKFDGPEFKEFKPFKVLEDE